MWRSADPWDKQGGAMPWLSAQSQTPAIADGFRVAECTADSALRTAPAAAAPAAMTCAANEQPKALNQSTPRKHKVSRAPSTSHKERLHERTPTESAATTIGSSPRSQLPHHKADRLYNIHGQLRWSPPRAPLPPASLGGLSGHSDLAWRPITSHDVEVSYLEEARRRGGASVLATPRTGELASAGPWGGHNLGPNSARQTSHQAPVTSVPFSLGRVDPVSASMLAATAEQRGGTRAWNSEVHFSTAAGSGQSAEYRVFPTEKPSSRAEAVLLGQTFDAMLASCGGVAEAEEEACDVVLRELVRQVGLHCTERGSVLDRVRQQCAALGESRRREIARLRAELARAQQNG